MMERLVEADQRRLDERFAAMLREQQTSIGYPVNALFDYTPLFRFLRLPVNNVGDPFVPSNFHLNTHEFERDVVRTFGELTHASPESAWGYVTTGGTEGNMYGIFLARELYPEGLVYYSEDTHYSVAKILRCLHVRNIVIRSQPDGSIDLEDLRETIKIHRDVPPIIFANIGTTMTGAIDDVAGIRKILKDLAIHAAYIHADAALSGMILPFVDRPPAWDFAAGIDSLAISGHKMIGSPIPCGVALAKKSNVERIARHVEYVGTLDTTIPGSRNGITPLFLWYALRTVGLDGFRRIVRGCLDVAEFAVERLNRAGRRAWRHPHSNTVVFDRPAPALVEKWQLAVQHNIAHVIAMPQVTRETIERFAADLERERPGAAP